MSKQGFLRRTFRITRYREDLPRDVEDEIQFHLEMKARELIESGLSPRQARQEARKAFGDRGRIESDCLQVSRSVRKKNRRAERVGSYLNDFALALRNLLRRPGYALVALLTVALCVAVNASIFSVVHAILLAPLPFPDSERIVILFNSYPNTGTQRSGNSVPDYYDRQEIDAFEEVALFLSRSHPVGEGEGLRQVFSMQITPSFFRVLQVQPGQGRDFGEEDGQPGRNTTVIISHGLSRELFGDRQQLLGEQLRVEGVMRTIVGVMPADFRFANWEAQIWLPMAFSAAEKSELARHSNGFSMIARLKPAATLEAARGQLEALNAAIAERLPPKWKQELESTGYHTQVHRLQDDLVRSVGPSLYLLWAAALFVMLIGCVSLANLHLVRSTGRLRELAARFVLGASRWRLIRLLLSESLLLGALGGAAGLLAAGWSLRLLEAFEVYQVPRINEVQLGAASILFALGLALLAGLVSGILPATALQRLDLFSVFRSAGRSSAGPAGRRLRGLLVALQVAVAFVLLAGAGLMLASLLQVRSEDPGFEPRGVLAAALTVPPQRYPDAGQRRQFIQQALQRIRALPAVKGAAVASQLPFSGSESQGPVTAEGQLRSSGESVQTHYSSVVSPGYFKAMGIPLLQGRSFDGRDRPGSQRVVIVDERLARSYWGNADPIGKRLVLGLEPGEGAPWCTVVGVVGEIRQNDLTDASPSGAYYLSHQQSALVFFRLAVKTDSDPRSLLGPLRRTIAGMDPEMTVFWVQTLQESLDEQLILRRIPLRLLAFFAALSLFLAAVGIYGVLDQSVRQRSREIGIRMALGSSRREVHRLVLGQSLRLVGAGQLAGLLAALLLGGWMARFLYQVRPGDPLVLASVAALTAAAALTASWLPTRRAARVNPVSALNAD